MSDDIKVTDGTVLETLNNKVDLDGGNYPGSGLEEYINTHRVGMQLFDTVLKDHILTYEESKGLALQGTYVYKEAIAGSRYGYADFYNKCLEEYNTSEGIEWTQPVLTSNTTIVNEGAITVTVNGAYSDGNAGYKVFDGDNTSTYWSVAGVTGYLQIKFPYKLAVTGLTFYQKGGDVGTKEAGFYTSSDLSTPIGDTFTASQTNYGATVVSNIPTEGIITDTIYLDVKSSYGSYIGASEIKITAKNLLYKVNPNGHIFYDIAYKQFVDDTFATTGMAWMYGIDTENERIFLPRNNYFEQMTGDISEVGQSVEAGLPNIDGKFRCSYRGSYAPTPAATGVFVKDGTCSIGVKGGNADDWGGVYSFDASRSSSVYKDDVDTVQPNAVKKLLYICVGNTVSESAVTDVVEVTTTENDTLPLGYHFYQAGAQPSVSYLKSQGQWNDGNVYTTFYNEFVNKIGQDFASGKVINYTEEYTDYDLVINQDNMTFRLPLLDGSEDLQSDKYIDLTLNTSGAKYTAPSNGWFILRKLTNAVDQYVELLNENTNAQLIINRPVSGSTAAVYMPCKKGDVVSAFYTAGGQLKYFRFVYAQGNGSLYFKVANAVQNLELLDAGEVLEAVNNVVPNNSSLIASYGIPDYSNGIQFTYTTAEVEQSYAIPNDGVISYTLTSIVGSYKEAYLKVNDNVIVRVASVGANYVGQTSGTMEVSKGDTIKLYGGYAETKYNGFIFYPLKGAN